MQSNMLPKAQKLFKKHLEPDETIQWAGQPMLPYDSYLPFWCRPWILFAIPAILAAVCLSLDYFIHRSIGVSSIIFGAFILLPLKGFRKQFGKDTYYAITNKRILYLCPYPGIEFAEQRLNTANAHLSTTKSDGTGSIMFSNTDSSNLRTIDLIDRAEFNDLKKLPYTIELTLHCIPNAAEVYDLINDLKQQMN